MNRILIYNRKSTSGFYDCECGQSFAKKLAFTTHHINVHSMATDFRCNYCGKYFVTKNRRKKHMISVHAIKMFKCDYKNCRKECLKQQDLDNHKKSVHKN